MGLESGEQSLHPGSVPTRGPWRALVPVGVWPQVQGCGQQSLPAFVHGHAEPLRSDKRTQEVNFNSLFFLEAPLPLANVRNALCQTSSLPDSVCALLTCCSRRRTVPTGPVFPVGPLGSVTARSVGRSRSGGADQLSVLCSVQPLPKGDQVLNFSDAEDLIDDSKLK